MLKVVYQDASPRYFSRVNATMRTGRRLRDLPEGTDLVRILGIDAPTELCWISPDATNPFLKFPSPESGGSYKNPLTCATSGRYTGRLGKVFRSAPYGSEPIANFKANGVSLS